MTSAYQPTMEEDLTKLNIEDEDDDPVIEQLDGDIKEDEFYFCLVGRVLTNMTVHFLSLRNILVKISGI